MFDPLSLRWACCAWQMACGDLSLQLLDSVGHHFLVDRDRLRRIDIGRGLMVNWPHVGSHTGSPTQTVAEVSAKNAGQIPQGRSHLIFRAEIGRPGRTGSWCLSLRSLNNIHQHVLVQKDFGALCIRLSWVDQGRKDRALLVYFADLFSSRGPMPRTSRCSTPLMPPAFVSLMWIAP